MKVDSKSTQPAGATLVELEITINASRDEVWDCMMDRATEWWPSDFYAARNTKSFVIEPKLGGRIYEDCGDDSGLIWFNIVGIEKPEYLIAVGQIRPPYGGPCTSCIQFDLVEKAEAETVLKISDALHGFLGDKIGDNMTDGWLHIFNNLKRVVES